MKRRIRRVTTMALIVTMLMQVSAFAAFSPTFHEASPNKRPISKSPYLEAQGVAFDTYTGKDGYAFNKSTDSNKYALIHFTIEGDNISQVKTVVYQGKHVGHPNDATIFKHKNKKYMLVAISGGKEVYSKTYTGKKTKIGVIRMDEYDKGTAKLRGVKIKVKKGVEYSGRPIKKANISGITYVGTKKVDKKKRPVFVFRDGLQMYAAYAKISKKRNITLVVYDRAKFNKSKIKSGSKNVATAQGVTYHNNYLYIPYSAEAGKDTKTKMLVARIKFSKLFKGKPTSSAKNFETTKVMNYNSYVSGYDEETGEAIKTPLEKHIPEGIFFKSLNGKSEMYINVNRGKKEGSSKDVDYVMVSNQKF